MKQFADENLLEYLKDLIRDGNRISDYRKDFIESTLIYDFPSKQDDTLFIDKFCNKVDKKLSGLYTGFPNEVGI